MSKIKSRHSPLVHILEIVWNVVIEGMTTVETDGNVCARLEITAKNLEKWSYLFSIQRLPIYRALWNVLPEKIYEK